MDLLNKGIVHKSLGKGIVTEFDGKYFTVEFASKTSKFAYPAAFEKFIAAEDTSINNMIMAEIAEAAAAKEEAKRLEQEAKEVVEQKHLEELAWKAGRSRVIGSSKPTKRTTRIEGQPMTFLVFQGNTFEAEHRGGYIWAPKYNAGGHTCHHWDRLLDVRKGDIILHCADGYIEAISIAKGPCYDAESSAALKAEQLWANDGRRVDCDYMKIKVPLKTADYKDTIVNYCGVKYAPFDKSGNGNMGYLFEIDKELARFFVELSTRKNRYLLDLDYVRKLLK